jgi:hypothetical protein
LNDVGGLLFSGDAKLGTTKEAPKDDVLILVVGFGDFVSSVYEALRVRLGLLVLGAVAVEIVEDCDVLFVLREPLLVLGRLDVGVLFPPPKIGPFLEKTPPLLSFAGVSGDLSIPVCPCSGTVHVQSPGIPPCQGAIGRLDRFGTYPARSNRSACTINSISSAGDVH